MTSEIRNVIQKYGGLAESLAQTFLSFAPLATSPDDHEAEQSIQLMQSITDVAALRHDKFVKHGASRIDAIKFILRFIKCFQLWLEMKSEKPRAYSFRLELIKLSLSMIVVRHSDERLIDTETDSDLEQDQTVYVGSRTGTRLRSISKLFLSSGTTDTQFSDFLHAIVPVVYLAASPKGGWKNATWTSWSLAIILEAASIMALPETRRIEKGTRVRRLIVESLLRQPMFDKTVGRPASGLSSLWNMIPLLRDLNYLEYYLQMHRKYFYFHQ